MGYDHKKVEKDAQEKWVALDLYTTDLSDETRDPYYLLFEFPYPSGDLHIGHWYAFAVTDIYARMLRARGKNVLFPIGFDAFGLPAENAAMKHGADPSAWTFANMERMTAQIKTMGTSVDWSKEVVTCKPEYYQWTQWLFARLFEHNLAERREASVKWCPKDQTVLANEQVDDGACNRCGTPVEEKVLTQWFLKITQYAERLLSGLDSLPWREDIKDAQRAWIGKSEGARLAFELRNKNIKRFVLLHGKGGSPEANFFPALRSSLENAGYEVQVPLLPNAKEPDDDEQADFVEKSCTLDETTIVLGHSFGGVVALRLSERGHKVAGTTLIATPFSGDFLDGKVRPTVKAACAKGFNFKKILENAGRISLIYDTDDSVISVSDGEAYADHLNIPLDLIKVRAAEPHFCSANEPAIVSHCLPQIKVFTTRPETIFGATYVVMAPEHPLAGQCGLASRNTDQVLSYIFATKRKTERERSENKDKTGVALEGITAINPANQEEIPVFIADYVLASYGTGAVMAVPAHDERDFAFAQKMHLPVRQVIAPPFIHQTEPGKFRSDEPVVVKNGIIAIIKHWEEEKYLCLKWKQVAWKTFLTGGVDEGYSAEETVLKEIREETGYTSAKIVKKLGVVDGFFYHPPKQKNQQVHGHIFVVELENGDQEAIDEEEQEKHEILWLTPDELKTALVADTHLYALKTLVEGYVPYTGSGSLVDSGEFTGRDSEEAKGDIVAHCGGEKTTNYRIRDWLVSRQRYWGCPIPVVYDPEGKPHLVPAEHLPWLLPTDVDFTPTGKAPLASSKELHERVVKIFGEGWTPEYDTLDTFVDSSWYFLRYLAPNDTQAFSSAEQMKKWTPVNRYSGGSEHTTMHLLYARFFTKALYDLSFVPVDEPFAERFNRGLILGPDGQKMSKSKGNVVNPDEFVERYGADAVRLYLAFIGPYNEPGNYPWNLEGVTSMRKFLDRVERLLARVTDTEVGEKLQQALAKTSLKVSEDGDRFKFNTAVAALMILVNELEKEKWVPKKALMTLAVLLAPFAPHLAEHLWEMLGGEGSVHEQLWPTEYELKAESEVAIGVQVNGKHRGAITIAPDASEEEAVRLAKEVTTVVNALGGKEPKRVIYVAGKILNIVV